MSLEEIAKTQEQPHIQVGSRGCQQVTAGKQCSPAPSSFTDTHSAPALRSLNEFVSMQAGKNRD